MEQLGFLFSLVKFWLKKIPHLQLFMAVSLVRDETNLLQLVIIHTKGDPDSNHGPCKILADVLFISLVIVEVVGHHNCHPREPLLHLTKSWGKFLLGFLRFGWRLGGILLHEVDDDLRHHPGSNMSRLVSDLLQKFCKFTGLHNWLHVGDFYSCCQTMQDLVRDLLSLDNSNTKFYRY